MKRKATAVWQGSGKEGNGHLTQYSFSSRFEEGVGTNPEELIAAAHAGCFTMKLSFVLGEAGFKPTELTTTCTITLENGSVTNSYLLLKANIPGISKEKFDDCAENAKANCPISKLLNTNISLSASLV